MSNRQNLTVIGAQWGDEGKGKFVDYIANKYKVVCRYQGGHNAGHTININSKQHIFHLLPSGIMSQKTLCVLGLGVVISLDSLQEEFKDLATTNITLKANDMCNKLQLDLNREIPFNSRFFIDKRCSVILPSHKYLDLAREERISRGLNSGQTNIGTTGKGIGPAYCDIAARIAIKIQDLINHASLLDKLNVICAEHRLLLSDYSAKDNQAVMRTTDPEYVAAYLLQSWHSVHRNLEVIDVGNLLNWCDDNQCPILFEGAQGALLDINVGSWPYVTSNSTRSSSAAIGAGISHEITGQRVGIFKSYQTRVGNGALPTELEGELQNKLRLVGNEYGATTGRNRRCGWLDLVLLKEVTQRDRLHGLCMTKADILENFSTVKMAVKYEYNNHATVDPFDSPLLDLSAVNKVVYEEFPVWKKSIYNLTHPDELDADFINFVTKIEKYLGVPIKWISTGSKRHQIIELPDGCIAYFSKKSN